MWNAKNASWEIVYVKKCGKMYYVPCMCPHVQYSSIFVVLALLSYMISTERKSVFICEVHKQMCCSSCDARHVCICWYMVDFISDFWNHLGHANSWIMHVLLYCWLVIIYVIFLVVEIALFFHFLLDVLLWII
jgi:hypothetical protein